MAKKPEGPPPQPTSTAPTIDIDKAFTEAEEQLKEGFKGQVPAGALEQVGRLQREAKEDVAKGTLTPKGAVNRVQNYVDGLLRSQNILKNGEKVAPAPELQGLFTKYGQTDVPPALSKKYERASKGEKKAFLENVEKGLKNEAEKRAQKEAERAAARLEAEQRRARKEHRPQRSVRAPRNVETTRAAPETGLDAEKTAITEAINKLYESRAAIDSDNAAQKILAAIPDETIREAIRASGGLRVRFSSSDGLKVTGGGDVMFVQTSPSSEGLVFPIPSQVRAASQVPWFKGAGAFDHITTAARARLVGGNLELVEKGVMSDAQAAAAPPASEPAAPIQIETNQAKATPVSQLEEEQGAGRPRPEPPPLPEPAEQVETEPEPPESKKDFLSQEEVDALLSGRSWPPQTPPAPEPAPQQPEPASQQQPERRGPPTELSPEQKEHWYDVQQKFDLAKAYEEMGDKEGAADILGEVVREGDEGQRSKAQQIIDTLQTSSQREERKAETLAPPAPEPPPRAPEPLPRAPEPPPSPASPEALPPKAEKTPEVIAAENRAAAAAVGKEFEISLMEEDKRSRDPLYQLLKRISEDPQADFKLEDAGLEYAVAIPRPGSKPGYFVANYVRVPTYHDALRKRASIPEDLRSQTDNFVWNWKDGTKWGKVAVFASDTLWNNLQDPNDPLFKYAQEIKNLQKQLENEQLPDAYAEAIARGEVESPDSEKFFNQILELKQEQHALWENTRDRVRTPEEEKKNLELGDKQWKLERQLNSFIDEVDPHVPSTLETEPLTNPDAVRSRIKELKSLRFSGAWGKEWESLQNYKQDRAWRRESTSLENKLREAGEPIEIEVQKPELPPKRWPGGVRLVEPTMGQPPEEFIGPPKPEDLGSRAANKAKMKGTVFELLRRTGEKIGAGFEKSQEYLKDRVAKLDAQGAQLTGFERMFHDIGDWYNRRSIYTKIATGLGLGVGAATLGSPLLIGLAVAGLTGQRILGLAGAFRNYEMGKMPSGLGFLAPETGSTYMSKRDKAFLYAVASTVGIGAGLSFGTDYFKDSSLGKMLQDFWGQKIHAAPSTDTPDGVPEGHPSSHVDGPRPEPAVTPSETPDGVPEGHPSSHQDGPPAEATAGEAMQKPAAAPAAAQEVPRAAAPPQPAVEVREPPAALRAEVDARFANPGQVADAEAPVAGEAPAAVAEPPTEAAESAPYVSQSGVEIRPPSEELRREADTRFATPEQPPDAAIPETAPATPEAAPEAAPGAGAPAELGPNGFVNTQNVPVNPDKPHIYAQGDRVYFYGKDVSDADAQRFAAEHKVSVFVDKSTDFFLFKAVQVVEYPPTEDGMPDFVIHRDKALVPDPQKFTKLLK